MIEINKLHVNVEDKPIITGIDLTLEKGKVHVLMGPNGSGKSTLGNTLMGHPQYTVTSGSIVLNGNDITSLPVHERAQAGLFLSFQYPREIPGVNVSGFLRQAYNATHTPTLSIFEFQTVLQEKMALLHMDQSFIERSLNEGFSGGEKKKMEILQLLVLNPQVAILDETDSGLDIDALKLVSQGINAFMGPDKTVLLITHYKRILDYITPDHIMVMMEGKIVHEGGPELIDVLEEKGYAWLKK
jgi:Fe-S cluster assembly ATP-binding protein